MYAKILVRLDGSKTAEKRCPWLVVSLAACKFPLSC